MRTAQQIASALRERIASGEFAPGALLPSERELIAEYGAAKNTVAKALSMLRADGLLVSQIGRGNFVRKIKRLRRDGTSRHLRSQRPEATSPLEAEVQEQGFRRELELREVALTPAPPDIAEMLSVEPGEPLIVRRHLITIDGTPAQTADSYFPASQVAGSRIGRPEVIPGGVHSELAAVLGRPLGNAVETLIARMPTPDETVMLQLPPGTPVVELVRVIRSEGSPVEVTHFLFDAARHEFAYEVPVD
ncbi:GntR family transcriptional regulator [Sinosporangium siamense]|nr:GntR family transcriptional regulator [Sinosporangium siamense]